MEKFRYDSYAQEIIFGVGSLNQLSESVDRLGCQRVMLCANHSMQVNGHISSIENIFPILWNVFPLSNEMSAQTVIIPLFSRVACNVGETSCLNS